MHWDRIQGGNPPKEDPLLLEGERLFFETLFINPIDISALNGLGSILILERELDAAEFFCTKAITIAKERHGVEHFEAKHDLKLIQDYKKAEVWHG
jgi:hypothetical protein